MRHGSTFFGGGSRATPGRPRDPIRLATLIGEVSVGDVPVDHGKPGEPVPEPAAAAKGEAQRAAGMTAKRRREIAKQGAAARWSRQP